MPTLNILVYISIVLIAGLLFGRLVKLAKLPNVTGYLIAGLLLGPSVSGIIPAETLHGFEVVSEMALAFIAFSIGLNFKRSYFKKVGAAPVVIATFEALTAVLFVVLILLVLGKDLPFALVLGAIAAATAPAATLMVIKQYRANGPVTETLMSVVAIDDAVALVAFSFAVTIAKSITGNADGSLFLAILEPFKEVFFSLLIGAIIGFLMKLPLKFFRKSGNRLIISVGAVFLSSGLCSLFGLSALLSCMMTGAVFCNVSDESDRIGELTDTITPPLFLLFFAVSGAELQISVLPTVGIIGAAYIIFRVMGKLAGSYIGCKLSKAPASVCKYLGPTLIPQAGVAIGLTLVAQTVVPEYAPQIRAIVLCATLVYEMVGPAITKITLTKAGEIPKAQ